MALRQGTKTSGIDGGSLPEVYRRFEGEALGSDSNPGKTLRKTLGNVVTEME